MARDENHFSIMFLLIYILQVAGLVYVVFTFGWQIDKLEEELKSANVTIKFYEGQNE